MSYGYPVYAYYPAPGSSYPAQGYAYYPPVRAYAYPPGSSARAPAYAYPPAYSYAPARVAPRPSPAPLAKREVTDQEKRANQLSAQLEIVRRERDQAQAELAVWTGLGVTPEQVKDFRALLNQLQEENRSLVRQNSDLDFKLSRYIGVEKEVKMPIELHGRVQAVDPKYQFVVLNIGEKQGLARNGKLLVNRDGHLVAKVRLTTVEANSSIANILPDWKLAEVREGDQVIHQ